MANETQILRVPPSGPPFLNSNGGEAGIGPGYRVRMTEANSVIGDGSEVIPTLASTVGAAGFSGDALALSMLLPKPSLSYRGKVIADIINTDTNDNASVTLIIQTSVNGGVNWTTQATNTHHVPAAADLASDISGARQVSLYLPKTLGSVLGVVADTDEILMRVAMASALNPALELSSETTPAPNAAKSQGTFHFELEEVF